jgi:hypothetical protein
LSSGKFVPVVVDTLITQLQKDAEGEFFRQLKRNTSCGSVMVITAGGRVVEPEPGTSKWDGALAAYKKLLPEERTPQVGELTNPDPTAPLRQLKPGTLRIKFWSRALKRDNQGEFTPVKWFMDIRHSDKYGGTWLPVEVLGKTPRSDYDPGYDYLWLEQAEWRTLIPKEMKAGHRFPLPQPLVAKLACDALNHTGLMRAPSTRWAPKHIKNLALDLTVTEATPTVVRMTLQGSVSHESPRDDAPYWRDESRLCRAHSFSNGDTPLKYDARLLGYLDYDRQKDAFTRFDIVSAGDYVAFYSNANDYGHILSHSLGVAFAVDPGPPVPPAKWHRPKPQAAK